MTRDPYVWGYWRPQNRLCWTALRDGRVSLVYWHSGRHFQVIARPTWNIGKRGWANLVAKMKRQLHFQLVEQFGPTKAMELNVMK